MRRRRFHGGQFRIPGSALGLGGEGQCRENDIGSRQRIGKRHAAGAATRRPCARSLMTPMPKAAASRRRLRQGAATDDDQRGAMQIADGVVEEAELRTCVPARLRQPIRDRRTRFGTKASMSAITFRSVWTA